MCPFTVFFKTDVGRKIPFRLRSLERKSRTSESSNNGIWLFPYQKPLSTTKAPIKGSSLIIPFGYKRAFLSRQNTSLVAHYTHSQTNTNTHTYIIHSIHVYMLNSTKLLLFLGIASYPSDGVYIGLDAT